MKEPSLLTSQNPLAFYDPDGACWKTFQDTLLSEEPALLEALPQWGTTADGVLYEHRMPVRLTAVRDGSALLGTPTAAMSQRSEKFRGGSIKTPTPKELALTLMATPRAYGPAKLFLRKTTDPQNLENQLARLPEILKEDGTLTEGKIVSTGETTPQQSNDGKTF